MGDSETLTSELEPGNPTSNSEPETDQPDISVPDGTPPSLDQLQARLKRLEANATGSRKEWEKEKQRAEKAETELQQLRYQITQQQMAYQAQQQAARPAAPQGDVYADLAKDEYDAIIEGNQAKLAQVRRRHAEIMASESDRRSQESMTRMTMMQQRQQALRNYMGRIGITDESSAAYQRTNKKLMEIAANPEYTMLSGNDPAMMAVIAANEVRAEMEREKAGAKSSARSESVTEGFTEGTRSSGSPPGTKVTSNRIYLNDAEMKLIRYDMKRGISEEEAKKRYWNHLPESVRLERLERKRA